MRRHQRQENLLSWPARHDQDFIDKSEELLDLFNEGYTYKEIAKLRTTPELAVRKYLNENPNFNMDLYKDIDDKQEQILELLKKGVSSERIADKFNYPVTGVNKFIQKHRSLSIALKSGKKLQKRYRFSTTKTDIEEKAAEVPALPDSAEKVSKEDIIKHKVIVFTEYNFTQKEIAEFLKIPVSTVKNYLGESANKAPDRIDMLNVNPMFSSKENRTVTKNQIYFLRNNKYSVDDIAELYDISIITVKKYLSEYPVVKDIITKSKLTLIDINTLNISPDFSENERMLVTKNQIYFLRRHGFSSQIIAELYNMSIIVIRKYLSEYPEFTPEIAQVNFISTLNIKEYFSENEKRLVTNNQIYFLRNKGFPIDYIAQLYSLSDSLIKFFLGEYPEVKDAPSKVNFISTLNIMEHFSTKEIRMVKKNQVYFLNIHGFTPVDIAELYDISITTVKNYLSEYPIFVEPVVHMDHFYELAKEGFSVKYIANVFDIETNLAFNRINEYSDLSDIRKLCEENKRIYMANKILFLYKQGFSTNQICKRLSIGFKNASNIINESQPIKVRGWFEWPNECASWKMMPIKKHFDKPFTGGLTGSTSKENKQKSIMTVDLLLKNSEPLDCKSRSNAGIRLNSKSREQREREVFDDLKCGMSFNEIGKKLGVTGTRVAQIIRSNPEYTKSIEDYNKSKIEAKKDKNSELKENRIQYKLSRTLTAMYPEQIKNRGVAICFSLFWASKPNQAANYATVYVPTASAILLQYRPVHNRVD